MIDHTAPMAAFLVVQATPPQCIVQCIQAAPGSWWNVLLQFLPQLIVSVIPVAGGVGIALWSFRATSKKEHERWILENIKTEWKELLTLTSAIELFLPTVATRDELISAVLDPSFTQHLRNMTQAALHCVFISEAKAKKIYRVMDKIQMNNEKAKKYIEAHRSNVSLAHQHGILEPWEATRQIQIEWSSLWREIRRFVAEDLELEPHKSWRETLTDWFKKPRRPEVVDKTSQNASTDVD